MIVKREGKTERIALGLVLEVHERVTFCGMTYDRQVQFQPLGFSRPDSIISGQPSGTKGIVLACSSSASVRHSSGTLYEALGLEICSYGVGRIRSSTGTRTTTRNSMSNSPELRRWIRNPMA